MGFNDVVADRVYSVNEFAALFGVSGETARRWCLSGSVPTLPRIGARASYRILGADIIALAGTRLQSVSRSDSETRSERAARAKRDLDAIGRLAKSR